MLIPFVMLLLVLLATIVIEIVVLRQPSSKRPAGDVRPPRTRTRAFLLCLPVFLVTLACAAVAPPAFVIVNLFCLRLFNAPEPSDLEMGLASVCGLLAAPIVLILGIVCGVALWLRLRRVPAGCCPRCGYNLRGNPSVKNCPECGAGCIGQSAAPPRREHPGA